MNISILNVFHDLNSLPIYANYQRRRYIMYDVSECNVERQKQFDMISLFTTVK